uniref:Uncharacterized protein n=1 Tax=Oryza punctata TaxID=4537 RepID=A0A0E0KNS2_ORYPU
MSWRTGQHAAGSWGSRGGGDERQATSQEDEASDPNNEWMKQSTDDSLPRRRPHLLVGVGSGVLESKSWPAVKSMAWIWGSVGKPSPGGVDWDCMVRLAPW